MFKLIKNKKKNKIVNSYININKAEIKISNKKIIITNQNIIDEIYLKEIFILFKSLSKKIITYLESDEEDDEKCEILYDELARLRAIILKEYENQLSEEAILKYMKNIRFLALSLQKKLSYLKNRKRSVKVR